MSIKRQIPDSVPAVDVPPRVRPSNYPEPFAARMAGRSKQHLGDFFGLRNFGVNLTTLAPGAVSSLHHRHSKQDEFIYVLQGRPTLFTDGGVTELAPGMCAGFSANGTAHHLINRTRQDVVILEVGDRSAKDEVSYPEDDIEARAVDGGGWVFVHKDGTPYG